MKNLDSRLRSTLNEDVKMAHDTDISGMREGDSAYHFLHACYELFCSLYNIIESDKHHSNAGRYAYNYLIQVEVRTK